MTRIQIQTREHEPQEQTLATLPRERTQLDDARQEIRQLKEQNAPRSGESEAERRGTSNRTRFCISSFV